MWKEEISICIKSQFKGFLCYTSGLLQKQSSICKAGVGGSAFAVFFDLQSLVDIWVFRKRWSGLQYAEHSCVDCVLHKHVLPVQKGGHVTGVFMRPSVQFSSSR